VLEYPELVCTTCGNVLYLEVAPKPIPPAKARGRPATNVKWVTKECVWCLGDFRVSNSSAIKRKRYCTTTCNQQAWEAEQNKRVDGNGAAQRGDVVHFGDEIRIERECAGCGKVMSLVPGSPRKYCTRPCYWHNRERKKV